MAVHTILELGNPVLRQPCTPVADPTSLEVQRVFEHLRDTLYEYRGRTGHGRAITAPMIGYHQRLIFIETSDVQLYLVNPRFVSWSRDEDSRYESCYCFSGLWGLVQRPVAVVVEAWDAQGEQQTIEASNSLARILQHEIDHLDGLLWIDRIPDLDSLCTTAEYEKRYTNR